MTQMYTYTHGPVSSSILCVLRRHRHTPRLQRSTHRRLLRLSVGVTSKFPLYMLVCSHIVKIPLLLFYLPHLFSLNSIPKSHYNYKILFSTSIFLSIIDFLILTITYGHRTLDLRLAWGHATAGM